MRELGITYTAAERRAMAARSNLKPDTGSRTAPHGDPLMDAFRTQATKEALAYMQGVIDGLDGDDGLGDDSAADSYVEGLVVGQRSREGRTA